MEILIDDGRFGLGEVRLGGKVDIMVASIAELRLLSPALRGSCTTRPSHPRPNQSLDDFEREIFDYATEGAAQPLIPLKRASAYLNRCSPDIT